MQVTSNINQNLEIVRVSSYSRTSTNRQEKEGTIESQIDQIYEKIESEYPYIKRNEVTQYKDDGWSGSTLERPGMDDLLASLKEDTWDVLVVPDPDRLARDPYLQLFVMEEIEKAGKKIMFCTIDSPDANNEDQLMMFELRGMMAKYEKVRINSRFRSGKLRKAKNHIMLSVSPYGYDLVKRHDDPKTGIKIETHIVINEKEAAVIRNIFNWYVHDKLSARQIAHKLKEIGAKPRKNKNGDWNTSTVGNILKNTTYIGQANYRRTEAIEPIKPIRKLQQKRRRDNRTSRKLRPAEQWMSVPVPAVLDTEKERELFQHAQEQREKNTKINPRNRINDYLLGGKIYCTCGAARTGEGPQGGKYLYYRCGGRHNNQSTESPKCALQAVNARIADEEVWNVAKQLVSKRSFLQDQMELFYSKKSGGNSLKEKISELKESIETLDSRITKLKQSVLEENLSMKHYTELRNEVDAKKLQMNKELQEAIKKSRQITKNLITDADLHLVLEESFTQLNDLNFNGKRAIVEQLIDEVVGEPGHLTVTGYIGLSSSSVLQEVEGNNYSSNSRINVKISSGNSRFAKRW